jgi:hypothetical protein
VSPLQKRFMKLKCRMRGAPAIVCGTDVYDSHCLKVMGWTGSPLRSSPPILRNSGNRRRC